MPTAPKAPDSLLVPEGTRILHIGPPKTGTKALQGALHNARSDLLAQGVRYAGRARQSRYPVYAALERPAYRHLTAPPPKARWRELVREIVQAPEPRVILSSEIFTDGDAAAIRRVVDDLDASRVHVAVTLRPLSRILASQWQQEVRGGRVTSFPDWLAEVFSERDTRSDYFWHRHRHDQLIASWASLVGTDRLTVVVVDERDHGMILRAFEGLLGLREGTLVEPPDGLNQSMSLPEVEAVRAYNIVAESMHLRPALRHRVSKRIRRFVVLPEPDPGEPRLETPQWAYDRAAAIAREMVDAISASGVRIVGDIESLAAQETSARPDDQAVEGVEYVPAAAWRFGSFLVRRGAPRVAARLGRTSPTH